MSYYFAKVPELPYEAQHQSGAISVVEYLVAEGDAIFAGTPILRAENWWAVMELDAVAPGILKKVFFDRGTYVSIGDPFAIIVCDPENGPRTAETARLRVVSITRAKPAQHAKA